MEGVGSAQYKVFLKAFVFLKILTLTMSEGHDWIRFERRFKLATTSSVPILSSSAFMFCSIELIWFHITFLSIFNDCRGCAILVFLSVNEMDIRGYYEKGKIVVKLGC